MDSTENYRDNIKIEDKLLLNNININKSTIINCPLNTVVKEILEESSTFIPPYATAIIGTNNTTASKLKEEKVCYYTDLDLQEEYLHTKPTNYLILSKPGVGAYKLGEQLSNKLKCIHLCPHNVIIDEIDQQSSTGKCIDFNLRHNKIISFDNIIEMMKQKISSPSIEHRGFIISGLPLVCTRRDLKYIVRSLYSEESMSVAFELIEEILSNIGKKKSHKTKIHLGTSKSSVSSTGEAEEEMAQEEENTEIIEEHEEENIPITMPKFILKSLADVILYKKLQVLPTAAVLLEQLNQLFNLPIRPDIIIYITCPDPDVITIKNHKCYDYKNNVYKNIPFHRNETSEIIWPPKYFTKNDNNVSITYNEFLLHSKYCCLPPMNFKVTASNQLCNYQEYILPLLQNKLQEYDPKFIIKIDGRTSIQSRTRHVIDRLQLIPMKHVIIPKPFYLNNDAEIPETTDDFWTYIDELDVGPTNIPKLNRFSSPWLNRCPIELKRGRSIQGKVKYAVLFLKYIYLLYSYESMVTFCMNPRPYLKLKYLQPTCRVIVIGTKASGKSMVCQLLSWLFDAKVYSFNNILNKERKKKYDRFARTILSELIGAIEDERNNIWTESESERELQLQQWLENTLNMLKRYIFLLNEKNITDEVAMEIERINNTLIDIPFLNDINECISLASDLNNLLVYAPHNLITVTQKPDIPRIGDEDVTNAISNYIASNELQGEIEPTPEELVQEFINVITIIDDENRQATNSEEFYGKWIFEDFPSTSEIWTLLSESDMLPDYTISLLENREITSELMTLYRNIQIIEKDYSDRFPYINDPLVQIRLFTHEIKDPKYLIYQIVEDILTKSLYQNEMNALEDEISKFNEHIEQYRADLDAIIIKVEENFKALIQIELEDKTDIDILEEILLKVRQAYNLRCIPNEDNEQPEDNDEDKDYTSYNDPQILCDTNIYCPIAYFNSNTLWEGKSNISTKFNNKIHFFSKEDAMIQFQKDPTKYQSYNIPKKELPPLRVCVVGCIGSGRSTLSQKLSTELGLIHVDFNDAVNELLLPRHFKPIGWKFENSFTDVPFDDEDADTQVDEESEVNEVDMLLSNEKEFRKRVYNYFEKGSPLPSKLLKQLLNKLWHEHPFSEHGFILDGFPRLMNDVEDMITSCCIPDIIIELESSSEASVSRIAQPMFQKWKIQLLEAKKLTKHRFEVKKMQWLKNIMLKVVIEITLIDILDKVLISIGEVTEMHTAASIVMEAHPSSSDVDMKLFKLFQDTSALDPEPIDESEWDKPDEVYEKIEMRIENIYGVEDENLQSMKGILEENKIKLVTLEGAKPIKKLLKNALLELEMKRNRNESFFEQTFVITKNTAEYLLEEGFIMTSVFNRMCPVYITENQNAIHNPYKIKNKNTDIFPVIHRCYIYFIYGKDNLKKFRNNPLVYVCSKNIHKYFEFPLRIGVNGAPKSGKSSLVNKCTQNFGVIPISMGNAIRYVIENLSWTDLANKILHTLNNGDCLCLNSIMDAVQVMSIDCHTITHGFVLDGFPKNSAELMQLTNIGLNPLIIFHFVCDNNKSVYNSQNELYYDIIKYHPPYPIPYVENRINNWNKMEIKETINNNLLNVCILNGNDSKWECWTKSKDIINNFRDKIHFYLDGLENVEHPVLAEVVCISKEVFMQRMSHYENLCPICLQSKVVRHNDWPLDRQGIIQYKNTFYWICREHIDLVFDNPSCLLREITEKLPEIPAVISHINKNIVHDNGICIVTYAENLPSQKWNKGKPEFAAAYKGKHYLLCSLECLKKFMEQPHLYFDIKVYKQSKLSKIPLDQLPHLGYLEQTLANLLTDSCCRVNVLRPKYPGLSVELSAFIFMALYLKIHNPKVKPSVLPSYDKAYKIYVARCKLITNVVLQLKAVNNPLATYPICCGFRKFTISGTASKQSTIVSPSTSVSCHEEKSME